MIKKKKKAVDRSAEEERWSEEGWCQKSKKKVRSLKGHLNERRQENDEVLDVERPSKARARADDGKLLKKN